MCRLALYIQLFYYYAFVKNTNYYTGIMALPLKDGYLDPIKKGVIHFSKALEPDESAIDRFDSKFAPLVKEVKECQALFEQAASEIDEAEY